MWYWRSFPPLTHPLKEVFVADSEGHDVMVIGQTVGPRSDGTHVRLRTAAHINLVPCEGQLLIQQIEIFAVSHHPSGLLWNSTVLFDHPSNLRTVAGPYENL